ncbi:hypothetical protein [Noviherbaspirillum sp. Root189]|uniref:hypothetical protein n=1 Tax=Noviherbaspirillum sp. Root189 TaxID=1736487 RepID=UPI0012E34B97|nr:hypothetical protein [Noviherbaspirillum sp. Root189]
MSKPISKSKTKNLKPSPRPAISKPKPDSGPKPKAKTPWTMEAASRIYSATHRKYGQIEKDSIAADAMSEAMRNQLK